MLKWFKKNKGKHVGQGAPEGPSNKGTEILPSKVFKAGAYPENNFIERTAPEVRGLKSALDAGGKIICISGQSKVGKTVLCQKLMGADKVIRIPGGQIDTYEKFIGLLAGPLNLASEVVVRDARGDGTETTKSGSLAGGLSVPGAAVAVGGATGSTKHQKNDHEEIRTIHAVLEHEVFEKLTLEQMVLMIDDFHRIDTNIQNRIISSAKDYLVSGRFRLVLVSIPTQAFEAVMNNPEMIGRYTHIKIPNWQQNELENIARVGFRLIGWNVDTGDMRKMAKFAYGNPLLVQEMCQTFVDQVGDRPFSKNLGVNAESVLSKLVEQYNRLFGAQLSAGSGEWQLKTKKTANLAQLTMLAASEYPWNRILTVSGPILTAMGEMLSKGSDLPAASHIANSLRGVSGRIHRPDSPIVFFELNESPLKLFLTDPHFRFYLQWGLRPTFGLKPGTKSIVEDEGNE